MSILSPFTPDWGEMWEDLKQTIMELGRDAFGNNLRELAEQVATTTLFSPLNPDFLRVYVIAYGVVVGGVFLSMLSASWRIGNAGTNIDKAHKGYVDIKHAGKLLLVGVLVPFLLFFLMVAVDLARQLALMIAPTGSWFNVYDAIQLITGGVLEDFLMKQWLANVATVAIDMEMAVVEQLYAFAILLFISYVFIEAKWGKAIFRTFLGIVLGFSAALPVQVAILALFAHASDMSFTVGLTAVIIASLLPLVLTVAFIWMDPYTRLTGGKSSVDGNVAVDEGPTEMVVKGEVDANVKNSPEITLVTTEAASSDVTPSMQPTVAAKTGSTLLVDRRFDADSQPVNTPAEATPPPALTASESPQPSKSDT